MTYLEILGWARKGIRAEKAKLHEMQDKALEKAGGNADARKMADMLQEQIDQLEVRSATLDEIEDLHNRK